MNEFKVVGGLIEIAASFKFLYMADFYFDIGILTRTSVLAMWALIALVLAVYVLGFIRLKSDSPLSKRGLGRIILALLFTALAAFFISGLAGIHLGSVEGLFPVRPAVS